MKVYALCMVVFLMSPITLSAAAPKAIVVGASTGIGREVVKVLASHGYELGICSRKTDLLKTLKKELKATIHVSYIDLMEIDQIHEILQELVNKMGGLDLIVVNSGIWPESQGGIMPKDHHFPFKWIGHRWIYDTITVNVTGCAAAFNFAFNYFLKQNHGHIVGISSVDALRGNAAGPAYCASKSFMSTFLEGIRNKCIQLNIPINVTEIRPGWIRTSDNEEDYKGAYWVTSAEVAAKDIYDAIVSKKKVAYVPKRWAIIGFLLKIVPDWLYNKIGGF